MLAAGALYGGVNFEFSGASIGLSIHGEQWGLCNALLAGETGLSHLFVSAAPCGHCRQFIAEINHGLPAALLHPIPSRPCAAADLVIEYWDVCKPLRELLPHAFYPSHLDNMQPLFAHPAAQHVLSCVPVSPGPMVDAALHALNRSYAPYSKCRAAVCLRFDDGTVAAGPYIENVAFNPSLPPFHAAVIGYLSGGAVPDLAVDKRVVLGHITHALLLQCAVPDGLSFAQTTREALASVAPAAVLEVVELAA